MNKKIIFIPLSIIIVVAFLYIWLSSQFIIVGDSPNFKNVFFCPSESRTIIEKYGINEKQVEGCQSKSFKLNAKNITFILLEYGRPNDCSSGCFFSHYCAIVEDGVDYPYAFYFTSPDENILNSEFDDWRSADESIMTGRAHPLADNQEFNDFLTNERENDGEFRWCK
jgi:hypothetical protein